MHCPGAILSKVRIFLSLPVWVLVIGVHLYIFDVMFLMRVLCSFLHAGHAAYNVQINGASHADINTKSIAGLFK